MRKVSKGVTLAVAAAILLSGGAITVGIAPPAQAATVTEAASVTDVKRILDDTNAFRVQNGLKPLLLTPNLNSVSQAWSEEMATVNRMSHNPAYSIQIPKGWWGAAENVAYGYRVDTVTPAWIKSPGHRANILGNYTHIGIGIARADNGQLYYTQNFGLYDAVPTPTVISNPQTTSGTLEFTSSWTAKAGVANYLVQVWRPDGSLIQKTTTTPKVTVTGLTKNTTYVVGVTARAVDKAGIEYRSPVKTYTVTTLPYAPAAAPTAPTGLKVAAMTYNEATLAWVAPTGVVGDLTGYTVTVKQTGKADRILKTTTPTVKVTGLTENTPYTVQVIANVASKDRTRAVTSPAVSLAIKTTFSPASTVKVGRPASLVTVAGKTTLTSTWKAPTVTGTLTGYVVTLKQGTTVVKTYSTNSLKASFSGLKPNTDYTFSVKAKAISSNGKYSATSSTALSTIKTLR